MPLHAGTGEPMFDAFNIYVTLVLAGLLILTLGYIMRRGKPGLVLMSIGIIILLGTIVYYVATVLA